MTRSIAFSFFLTDCFSSLVLKRFNPRSPNLNPELVPSPAPQAQALAKRAYEAHGIFKENSDASWTIACSGSRAGKIAGYSSRADGCKKDSISEDISRYVVLV